MSVVVIHTNNKAEKMAALRQWVDEKEAKSSIRQGSKEWLESKKTTIGGSEMATIACCNPYNNLYDLVLGKTGEKPFVSQIAMQWGKMFEPIIKLYTEKRYDVSIIGDDLFLPGIVPNQSYSPDGLGVIDCECVTPIEFEIRGEKCSAVQIHTYETALFEFKCPFSRNVKYKGKAPEYYLPQVLTGLKCTPSDVGIYLEGYFRLCAWDACTYSRGYNNTMTPRDLAEMRSLYPLARGFVMIYGRNTIAGFSAGDVHDLGERVTNHALSELFKMVDDAKMQFAYSQVVIGKADPTSNNLVDQYTEYVDEISIMYPDATIFLLPYKLLYTNCAHIARDDGYVMRWHPFIKDAVEIVEEYRADRNRDNLSARTRIYTAKVASFQGSTDESNRSPPRENQSHDEMRERVIDDDIAAMIRSMQQLDKK